MDPLNSTCAAQQTVSTVHLLVDTAGSSSADVPSGSADLQDDTSGGGAAAEDEEAAEPDGLAAPQNDMEAMAAMGFGAFGGSRKEG